MRTAFNLVCIFICLSVNAQNETNSPNNYTTREGLSNNSVRCLMQDSRKFLWIGTWEGLNRFDGHEFKKFYSQPNNPNSLAHNYIFNILEYKYGQLLICTNSGLSVLNTLTGQFENHKIDFPALKAGSGTAVLHADKAGDGKIWVNHSGELDVLDSNLKYLYRFTDIPWASSLKGSIIFKTWQTDRQQRIWLVTDTSGIQIIDFAAKQVWNYKNNPQKLSFLDEKYRYTRAFFLDTANNILWYAPWGRGLIKHDLNTHKEEHQLFDLPQGEEYGSVNVILPIGGDRLFCGAGEKLCEMDMNSLSYTVVDNKNVLALIQTADNQFWGGTPQGIMRVKTTPSFSKVLSLIRPGDPVDPNSCTGLIITRDGQVYSSYLDNLLFEIDKKRNSFTAYSIPNQGKIAIREVCEDKTGQLWIGTSKGIFFFDRETKRFSRPAFLPTELFQAGINLIFCDHNGDIWIGTRAPFFLYRFNASKKSIERIENEIINHFTALYADSRISRIIEDNKNNLWMISYLGGGIVNFNKATGEWKMYPKSTRYKSLLVDRGITALYADQNTDLWFTDDFGNGLMRYNYLTDSLSRITRNNGLASDYILNMNADKANNLWMFTEYGLTRFNMQNLEAVSYDPQDIPIGAFGYDENLFDTVTNNLVCVLDKDLLFIETNHLKKDTAGIIPFIDRITVNNKDIFVDAAAQSLTLKHDESNIAIEFTAVDLLNLHNMHFAYQLSGLDTTWISSDVSRSAQFANLGPGEYIFNIKTARENGKWGAVYPAFRFTIRPVFWQTAWFRLLVFCFIAFSVFWFVRRRIRIIRREAELKHKVAEAEMLALRSQMNPHFIFNCLNAIDNLIQTNQADKATTYLARFAKLIRSVLESTKNNLVPFYKDFESLRLFLELEQFRCNDKFAYEIRADDELLDGDYKVPPLIIQPFVENAIHHGLLNKENSERKLLVKASLENNIIKYIVQDNGVGRIKAREIKDLNRPEHVSFGIQITTERIRLHNQTDDTNNVVITDLGEKDSVTGTLVTVKLKV